MKGRLFLIFAVLMILFLVPFSEGPLGAPFYEGKVIRMVVGSEPGGGYDRMARILAKHVPKYIPGNPSIVVENMPGASSLIAANYLYNIAKPDGLTIGTFNQGLPFAQLLNAEGIKFDLTKFSWIGSTAPEASLLALRADLPYRTVDDLRRAKEIALGSTGPANQNYQFPHLLREFLGINFKMVIYPSSTAIMLAIERKEVDGRGGTFTSLKPFLERGLVRALLRGRISEPEIEALPVDEDFTTDQKAKTIMAMRAAPDRHARPYAAPPRVPVDRMNILRSAFDKVARDPELKEDAKKLMISVVYSPPEEVLKMLSYILHQPDDIVKEFGKYIKF